ncbi:MAG: dTMP kinase [Spirochaetaceae bacterium]|jgi:dTMP kinase|nr:dTMP kinase [Spirochaetaceae bacterium]
MSVLSNFIVFEGCDGSGTSTAISRLIKRYEQAGVKAIFTAEPTETETGILLRSALAGKSRFSPQTLAYLFAADRAEHLYGKGGIVELCGQAPVICDRYVLSSLVYQGIECGDELPSRLNSSFPAPEKLFFFDVEIETAQKRIAGRELTEIYEGADFQQKVRAAYRSKLDFCRAQGSAVYIVDASKPPEEVEEYVWTALCSR